MRERDEITREREITREGDYEGERIPASRKGMFETRINLNPLPLPSQPQFSVIHAQNPIRLVVLHLPDCSPEKER